MPRGKAGLLKRPKDLAVAPEIEELARPRASTAVDERIGRRLREARLSKNFSLLDLAELAQTAPQQLQKYETARTRVSASRLYQLARILDRPVFWFFEED